MSNSSRWHSVLRLDDETQLSVEPFNSSDLNAIYQIELRSHSHPWQRAHFASSLQASQHHCLGVRRGDEWVAYAVISCAGGEAELLLLVVDKPWQGRGLAKHFLDHIFRSLNGQADTLFLEVRTSNHRAIGLYESMEFNQVGVRPGYYPAAGRGEDALIYARML